jgi:hypothetical protein
LVVNAVLTLRARLNGVNEQAPEEAEGPIYRRSEVFVVGGQPTITYNPRPSQGLTQRFNDYLEERGRILCVTGPTKSGKTVLARDVVPRAIRVSGGEISSIDEFWADVVDGLAAYTEETAERAAAESSGKTDAYSGAAKVMGSGIEGSHSSTSGSGTTTRYTQSRSRDPRRVAKQELIKAKPPVVLDDFHHIEPAVQRQIVRGVKDLVFEGGTGHLRSGSAPGRRRCPCRTGDAEARRAARDQAVVPRGARRDCGQGL